MCGIAGFTRFHHPTGDMELLRHMGSAIFHRGPDASGEYLDEKVGLCHRRLSIIDLSTVGNQPMYADKGQLIIVFNGEIYNFLELRAKLAARGYKFKTKTDTEVILALYQYEGENLVDKINGMFAFALWDKQKSSLFIARDRLGKKPLYYYNIGGYFIFASEIKSLLKAKLIPRRLRADAVYDYFTFQYIPDPKSIFEDIYKLEPGYMLTVTKDGINKRQYWDLSFQRKKTESIETISNELLDIVEKSVKQRMISDVPIGAFLSGGIDSSGIVGLMARNSEIPVTTCSIGFSSKEFDEIEYARQVAMQFKTDHHEFTVRKDVESNLEKIASFFDEPFADPSLVPTFFVSELARQKVIVALAGDGGDESFAGYSKYAIDKLENHLRAMVPAFIRKNLLPVAAGILNQFNNKLSRKGYTLLNTLSTDPAYGFYLTNSFFDEKLWRSIITDEFKHRLKDYHPSSIMTQYYEKSDAKDHLDKVLYTDIKTYLPGDILVKVDRMSMANSLEVRAPLLDYRVIEYAARIPSELKIKGSDKKYILKNAFSKILTHDILYRKKMGFSVPLASWFRNEIKNQAELILLNATDGLPAYFKMDHVEDVWQQHQNKVRDYSTELWSMLMFQMWHNRYA